MPFSNPVPPIPMVEGKFDSDTQRRHITNSSESNGRVMALEALLEPYIETFFDTADGQRLAALARPAGNPTATGSIRGFQAIMATFSGTTYVGIYLYSKLLASPDYTDTIDISNLLTSITPDADDTGWLTTSTSDRGWLEVPITDNTTDPFSFGTATIKSTANGDDWGGGEVENDGSATPAQTVARRTLWETGADSDGNPMFTFLWDAGILRMNYYLTDSFDSGGGTEQIIYAAYPEPG